MKIIKNGFGAKKCPRVDFLAPLDWYERALQVQVRATFCEKKISHILGNPLLQDAEGTGCSTGAALGSGLRVSKGLAG